MYIAERREKVENVAREIVKTCKVIQRALMIIVFMLKVVGEGMRKLVSVVLFLNVITLSFWTALNKKILSWTNKKPCLSRHTSWMKNMWLYIFTLGPECRTKNQTDQTVNFP